MKITARLFKLILILSVINQNSPLVSQNNADIEKVYHLFETDPGKPDYKVYFKENHNEIQVLTTSFFVFYKSFISSQDGNHCVFHPSCSVYALESIKKNGFFIGLADGIDRLMRCNRLSPENYQRFENTTLFFDPVAEQDEKK
ncbi:MAG: membrane protein insertion efficiency factor YidD [Bacteroidales bacterium]